MARIGNRTFVLVAVNVPDAFRFWKRFRAFYQRPSPTAVSEQSRLLYRHGLEPFWCIIASDRQPRPGIRVSLYGAGQVNGNVARILAARERVEVRGPWSRRDRSTALEGRRRRGGDCHHLAEVAPDIRDAVKAGANVITTRRRRRSPPR